LKHVMSVLNNVTTFPVSIDGFGKGRGSLG
jgi:hypothetical protein